jgi:hypothetical protein
VDKEHIKGAADKGRREGRVREKGGAAKAPGGPR